MWKNSQRDHQHYYPKKYDDAIHLFYTNIEVNGHNVYMLNSLEEMLEEIAANLLLPKGDRPKTDTGLIDKTQFAEILKLKKSARVTQCHELLKSKYQNGKDLCGCIY